MPRNVKTDTSPQGNYHSFGKARGTEILRHRRNDGSLSGIVFKYEGGLLTARHVVEAHNLSGFKSHEGSHYDIAYKEDRGCHGLKLGYVDGISIDDVAMVTSSIEEPDKLVTLSGRVGVYFLPTHLHPFRPSDQNATNYLKPGASGSPLIYKDHIIGVVPFQNLNDPYEVAVVVFSGQAVKNDMEIFGLRFEEVK